MIIKNGQVFNSNGRFIPADPVARVRCFEWLMFQAAGLGPMFGQSGYFLKLAPEKVPAAIDRFHAEAKRNMRVLDPGMAGRCSRMGAGAEESGVTRRRADGLFVRSTDALVLVVGCEQKGTCHGEMR